MRNNKRRSIKGLSDLIGLKNFSWSTDIGV